MAFASVSTEHDMPFNGGVYQYRVRGGVHTRISTSLHPNPHSSLESERRRRYGQLYVVDSAEATAERLRERPNRGLSEELMKLLDRIIRENNVYAQAYQTTAEIEKEEMRKAEEEARRNGLAVPSVPSVRLTFGLRPGQDRRQYNRSTANEVYAVFVTSSDGFVPEAYITVHNNGGRIRQLETFDENMEPMCFPLFFPHGTRGWTPGIKYQNPRPSRAKNSRTELTRREHICYRLAIRRGRFNPMFFGGKLFQEYLVVQQVHIESDRLRWLRDNQHKIKSHLYADAQILLQNVAIERGAYMGNVVILPSTFPGSPRYMAERYNESMALVKHFGTPSLFITFTCNPKWREIREACAYEYVSRNGLRCSVTQSANERPDVIVRVFKRKVDWFIEKVKSGYFGEAVCWHYVIEFQMRGLPHCHALITLAVADKPSDARKVDSLISAEIPDPLQEPEIYERVKAHMIHGPCRPELCLNEEGRCNKKFPKDFRDFTDVEVDSFSLYKRPNNDRYVRYDNGYEADNSYVVPFNKRLLLELDCHCNV
ncbi:hypothetical protein AAVH_19338 [Aphelenchoides avenae]|nr:hypothetical protein AAVH_19338 [Aphelenchus avenae]